MTIILYAIPMFFLLIFIELIADKVRQTGHYQFNDAISSLTIGMLSRVAKVITALIPLSIYAVLVEHVAVIEWPLGALAWCMAFVLYDFLYYWNHRLGHEVSVLWAAHVVHHSSEEYNLTTALRQTSGSILNWIFFLPMAFLGIPTETMISIAALNLVYQFWVHTQHIDKLGVLDRIIVTPSNHRVHHAQNQRYIDKNYGGVLIIWDRLFGTFQPEIDSDPPVYGIRTALNSFNPIRTNLQVYKQLCLDSWHTKRWFDKWRVWFGRTGWRPADILATLPAKPAFNPETFKKFEVPLTTTRIGYISFQFGLSLSVTLAILLSIKTFTTWQALGWSLVLTVMLTTQGILLERHRWSINAEVIKWLSVGFGLWLLPYPQWLLIAVVGLALISTIWLVWYKGDPKVFDHRISS